MPTVLDVSATPSLVLAQPLLTALAAKSPLAVVAHEEADPVAFPARTVWRESPLWRLATIGVPLFTEAQMEKISPCSHFLPLSLLPKTPARTTSPTAPAGIGWTPSPRAPVSRYSPGPAPALCHGGFQQVASPARVRAAALIAEPQPAALAPTTLLPRLGLHGVPAVPARSLLDPRLVESARKIESSPATAPPVEAAPEPVLQAAGIRSRTAEVTSLAPAATLLFTGLAPRALAAAMINQAEFLPMAAVPRLPVLRAMPVRQTLLVGSSRMAEPRVSKTAGQLLDATGEAVAVSASKLPILVSVLRHARMAKAQRTSPVVFEFEGVSPRQQLNVPLAYMELPIPARQPRLPDSRVLRIVETFEYLRPLDQPGLNPLEALARLWRNTPVLVRLAAASASVIILLWAAAPSVQVTQMAESQWSEVRKAVGDRAAVRLTEDFPPGLPDWEGEGDWTSSWTFEPAGFVRPGRLAFYRPSMTMKDYSVEFLAQVEKKGVSWVYRAIDQENYYASKIAIVKPGPLPSLSLIRYPVIDGKKGPVVEIPIRVLMHNDTPYRVQLRVKGRDFTTLIEGQLVDFWRDDRLRVGGVGFFSETGEMARLYWMKLSHQDDFIGRVCAYFYPNPIQMRRGN